MKVLIILGFITFAGFAIAWTFFHLGRLIGLLKERCRPKG